MMHFAMFLTLRCTLHRFSSPDFREAFNEQGNKENVKLIIKKLASDTHEKKEKYIQKQRKNKIYIGNTVGILKPKKKCTHSVEKALNMRTDIRKKKKKQDRRKTENGKKTMWPSTCFIVGSLFVVEFPFLVPQRGGTPTNLKRTSEKGIEGCHEKKRTIAKTSRERRRSTANSRSYWVVLLL